MGPKANKSKFVCGLFLVDQYQVRFQVAITEFFPLAAQCMVVISRFQRLVICQPDQDGNQNSVQRRPVSALQLTPVIAFELTGPLNPSHSDRP